MSLAGRRERQKEGTNYASESCTSQHEKGTVVEDCSLSREVGGERRGGHRPWEANRRFLFIVSFSLSLPPRESTHLPCESTHTCNYGKLLNRRRQCRSRDARRIPNVNAGKRIS